MRNTLIASAVLVLGTTAVLTAAVVTGAANASTPQAAPATLTVVAGDNVREKSVGLVTQLRERALDPAGNPVGRIRWNCANGADWHCTIVYTLKGQGALVATGIFAGFNGEALAVTGGTGAYEGASGQVVLSVQGGEFTHEFDLEP